MITSLTQKAIDLLQNLIETPSFSGKEDQTALLLEKWFADYNIPIQRENNNIWAFNKYFDSTKPTILLNSHHDTVKPNTNYTLDPFKANIKESQLFGLGSNDAGGCLVSLLATFTYFFEQKNLAYNFVIVTSAEEENSGSKGLNSVLQHLPDISFAIVGEPTQMQLAIAEKGLMVLDVTVKGTASHAAHPNPENSIYKSLEIIKWFRDYEFEKVSDILGKVKMTVTQLNAGKQHNVVPGETKLVVDCRITDCYNNQEVLDTVKNKLPEFVNVSPRSMHLGSSSINKNHPIVLAGIGMGRETYGSPTLSDQAVLSCPSLKLGPGDSKRSHSADEFIYIDEIKDGIEIYINLLKKIL